MLRPLIQDLGFALLPLALGVLAFWGGRRNARWPRVVQVVSVLIAVVIVAGGVAAIARLVPDSVNDVVSLVGGSTVLLSWVSLFLLGVAWSAPNRRMSTVFLGCIAFVAGCLLAIEGGGLLWWRFGDPALLQNFPDAQGHMLQTSGATCSPTAAAMLLHQYGIRASEGEMAYLAGTSLLGSDGPQMARALSRKVRSHGWRAFSRHMSYDECVRRGEPFVAHIEGGTLGHAVVVTRITPEGIQLIDPGEGQTKFMSRAEFERVWDGTVVGIERTAN